MARRRRFMGDNQDRRKVVYATSTTAQPWQSYLECKPEGMVNINDPLLSKPVQSVSPLALADIFQQQPTNTVLAQQPTNNPPNLWTSSPSTWSAIVSVGEEELSAMKASHNNAEQMSNYTPIGTYNPVQPGGNCHEARPMQTFMGPFYQNNQSHKENPVWQNGQLPYPGPQFPPQRRHSQPAAAFAPQHPTGMPSRRNSLPNGPINMGSSKTKCVAMHPPIPKRFKGDMERLKDVKLPDFNSLVNYPINCNISHKQQVDPFWPEGMRCCVMCNMARPAGTKKHPKGHYNGVIIPAQNKGLCTVCDVGVFIVTATGLEIKWCKGCKNFRTWAAFGEKGSSTKCAPCRERQRKKYLEQKETRDKKKGRTGKTKASKESVSKESVLVTATTVEPPAVLRTGRNPNTFAAPATAPPPPLDPSIDAFAAV